MMLFTVFCVVLISGFTVINCDEKSGPGKWQMLDVMGCQNFNLVKFNVDQKLINRTHSGWSGDMEFTDDLPKELKLRMEIEEKVNGVFKYMLTVSKDSVVSVLDEYAKNNFRSFLQSAGVDPPEFPIKAGTYTMENYVFDESELPEEATSFTYNEYLVKILLIHDVDEVFCIQCNLEFVETED